MATMKAPKEKWSENYEIFTNEEQTLRDEVTEMEANSLWISDIKSSELALLPIPDLMEARNLEMQYGLSGDLTEENMQDGTKLVLRYNAMEHKNISRAAFATLCETAKLNGSALSRMNPVALAQCLQYGLDVARGDSLLLLRYDKIMALHSGAEYGYCVMPISELMDTAQRVLSARFGTLEFLLGYHANTYTRVVWALPDVQNEFLDKYQRIAANSVSHAYSIDFMPAIIFSASDTATSSAILQPAFVRNGKIPVVFSRGIAVKHKKSAGVYGMDLFEQEVANVFTKFNETLEVIEEMMKTEIYNPVNCLIGICNFINRSPGSTIARKYADAAREEVEIYAANSPVMSMHDIYLSMSCIIEAAMDDGKKDLTALEDAIARVATLDWKQFDVGGTVAWGDKSKAV